MLTNPIGISGQQLRPRLIHLLNTAIILFIKVLNFTFSYHIIELIGILSKSGNHRHIQVEIFGGNESELGLRWAC
jgi:hypothetical protein